MFILEGGPMATFDSSEQELLRRIGELKTVCMNFGMAISGSKIKAMHGD